MAERSKREVRIGKSGVRVACVWEGGARIGTTGRVVDPSTCKKCGGGGGLIGMHNSFYVLDKLCWEGKR